MTKGFITIATGDERYYQMARNLLRSYRQTCKKPMRFALIADRQNEYTAEFDDVVILEHPAHSWMDKLALLSNCPYEENIFIDADCLVYQDINFLWQLFENADDFSCFGSVLPMEATDGWFQKDAQTLYPIHFITHLHGMLYFIRKGSSIAQMEQWCKKIIQDYHAVSFKAFNDVLADEPVFALAMAIMNFRPIERKPEYYCFVPFATKVSTDYYRRKVTYTNPKDGTVKSCAIVHWGNKNTQSFRYRSDAHAIQATQSAGSHCYIRNLLLYRFRLVFCWYRITALAKQFAGFVRWVSERIGAKIRKLTHRQR